jgi:resuscitation-promoting factor RpfB
VRPSPARAEPHDEQSWLPLPDVDALPELEDHVATSPAATEVHSALPDDAVAPPSPARARPHDATAWLPLPSTDELDDLPSIEELLTSPWEAPPSPARAEPHDATAWLPLPEPDALPSAEIAGASGQGRAPTTSRHGRARAWAAGISALVVLTVLAAAFGLNHIVNDQTSVQLRVDGTRRTIEDASGTVGEVLLAAHVKLGTHDRVIPPASAEVRDGQAISVLRAFPITRDLDGAVTTVYTAYPSPSDYLHRDLRGDDRYVFRSKPDRLQADSTITLRTPHSGSLMVDGLPVTYDDIPALDVRELLAQYSVELGGEDYVMRGTQSVPVSTRLFDGDSYTVIRVGRELMRENVEYTLPDERRPDHTMNVTDPPRVIPGKAGVMTSTYQITRVNGVEDQRRIVSRVPATVAVPTITYYGTKADPMWDKIAACETGGNWGVVAPIYSGGLGFYNGTWDQFGGRDFASNAGLATREEQIIVAERIRAAVGISGWGCAHVLGYIR